MRYLKFNHGSECPYNVLSVYASWTTEVIDAERGLRIDKMAAIAARHTRWRDGAWQPGQLFETTDTYKLWDWIAARTARKQRLWIFGYGMQQQAELIGLYEQIEKCALRWQAGQLQEDGDVKRKGHGYFTADAHPWILKGLLRFRSVLICDLLNYVQKPLSEFAAGHPLWDRENWDATYANSDAYSQAWMASDVIQWWITGAIDLWRSSDLGTWQPTAAKLAMNAYQHSCSKGASNGQDNATEGKHSRQRKQTATAIVLHNDTEVKALERASYYGGKAEAYYLGEYTGKVYYLDVCALYPYIASTSMMPIKLNSYTGLHDADSLRELIERYVCIADVDIVRPGSLFPYRIADGERTRFVKPNGLGEYLNGPCVIYPDGAYRTTLAGQELRRALRMGHVAQVHKVATYHGADVFRGFFAEWFQRRCEFEDRPDNSGACGAALAKLVMNGLLGKFGQRTSKWTDAPEFVPPKPWIEFYWAHAQRRKWERYRCIGWNAQRYDGPQEMEYSAVAIPSVTCAGGREHMEGIKQQLPQRSVLLQDTDGLIVTADGYDAARRLPGFGERRMGALRLKDQADGIEIVGPRHYRFGDRWVLSGLSKAWAPGAKGTYSQWLSDWLLSRILGLQHGSFCTKLKPWKLDRVYSGRWRSDDGWTSPILVGLGGKEPRPL